MKVLLDTHAFLWMIDGGPLSEVAQRTLLAPEYDLYLSAASYWEICIKLSLGKLVLAEGWTEVIREEMLVNGIRWLPIRVEHCQALVALPFVHRDPFDRLLIAQAQLEEMTILTADSHIHRYAVPTLW